MKFSKWLLLSLFIFRCEAVIAVTQAQVYDSSSYATAIVSTVFPGTSSMLVPQMTRVYMVLAAGSQGAGTSSCVPIPACPVGWKPLVYGTPMQVEGRNTNTVNNFNQSSLYPIFGYAVGAVVGGGGCTEDQWQISIYVAVPAQADNSNPEKFNDQPPTPPAIQAPSVPGWAQVMTRCCNPDDPVESCS